MAGAEHLDVGAWGSLDGAGDAGSEDRQQAVRGSFATMCDSAMALGAAVAVVALATGHFMVGCLVGAVLCGMAEAHGRCGMSHIGMTAPFAGFEPRMWLRCVSAYSIAGVATSYLVGLAIAGVGTLAAYAAPQMLLYLGAAAVVVAMMLRELGLIRFDPPQCNVQTHKDWVYEFGLPTAAGMWGAHIGLGLTTVITHGGLYALVLVAFAGGLGNGEWIIAFGGSRRREARAERY